MGKKSSNGQRKVIIILETIPRVRDNSDRFFCEVNAQWFASTIRCFSDGKIKILLDCKQCRNVFQVKGSVSPL